jgi:hypothetical protein
MFAAAISSRLAGRARMSSGRATPPNSRDPRAAAEEKFSA